MTGVLGFLWISAVPLAVSIARGPSAPVAGGTQDILANRAIAAPARHRAVSYRTLLRLPQTWGILIGKGLTDPVWFFITDWFAIYLAASGFPLDDSLLAFWVPFMAADLGNFAGGGVSSFLIKRGWPVGFARKTVIVLGTPGDVSS